VIDASQRRNRVILSDSVVQHNYTLHLSPGTDRQDKNTNREPAEPGGFDEWMDCA